MNHYCICLGYESLVIPFKLIADGESSVTILTNRDDIILLCGFLKIPAKIIPNFSFFDSIKNSKEIKLKINRFLKELENKNSVFHFTHKNYDVHIVLISIIAKNTKCIFHRTEIDWEIEKKFTLLYISTFKNIFKYYLFYPFVCKYLFNKYYGLRLTYRIVMERILPIITDKYMAQIGVKIIDYIDKDELFIEAYGKYNIEMMKSDNLFLFPDIEEWTKWVTVESIQALIDFIDKKENVVYKYHPNRIMISNKNQYPKYIPAELIIPNITKNIITSWSAVIRYSAKNKNICTIVCTELLNWHDLEQKKLFTDLARKWGCTVFPKSYDEIENLLLEN
jgi:hypothetical protein